MSQTNQWTRRQARRRVVQALYQWTLSGNELSELSAQYVAEMNPKKVDVLYFKEILNGVLQQVASIDEGLAGFTDIAITELDPIELNILRLGYFELQHRIEVPFRVVINESTELAKVFGASESYKFINGVLDKAAKVLRTVECG